MKAALAIVLAVSVAGFVECMPQLKQSAQDRLAALKDNRDEGKDYNWPYAWMAFSQLIGKCVSTSNIFEAFEIELTDIDEEYCILAKACPCAINLGEELMNATAEKKEELVQYVQTLLPLLQCVNLEADKEGVLFALYLNGGDPEDNIYLQESKELFDVCKKVFDTVKAEEAEFEKELEKVEYILGGAKCSSKAGWRRLLEIASRKF